MVKILAFALCLLFTASSIERELHNQIFFYNPRAKIFTEKIKQRTLGYFVLAHNIGVSSRAVARLGDET